MNKLEALKSQEKWKRTNTYLDFLGVLTSIFVIISAGGANNKLFVVIGVCLGLFNCIVGRSDGRAWYFISEQVKILSGEKDPKKD